MDQEEKTSPGGFCATLLCNGVPRYRFTWPGNKEQLACAECAERARNTAAAMFFNLEILPRN